MMGLTELNLLTLSKKELVKALKDGMLTIAVYGLGRIGLPLALAWMRAGAKAIGVDVNRRWVEELNSGRFEFPDEPSLELLLKHYLDLGLFKATSNGVEASKSSNIKLITVPTLIDEKGDPDLSSLKAALSTIGRGLKHGDLVVIESSVPPGTTINLAKPILEAASNLICEADFGLAYSPERVMVGHALRDIEERYPKIVGGVGPGSTEILATLYRQIASKGVIEMTSATSAELSKLFEGVYRDVNIALANELSSLCRRYRVDFMEIRRASNSQPYCHLHKPGVGVGGACIPVYPKYILYLAKTLNLQLRLTEEAREINASIPKMITRLLIEELTRVGKDIDHVKVAILGLAFRGDTTDTRLSPAYGIIRELSKHNLEIRVNDPMLKEDRLLAEEGYQLLPLHEAISNVDAIIIATDHSKYKELSLDQFAASAKKPLILLDGKNIYLNRSPVKGIIYLSTSGRCWRHIYVHSGIFKTC